jgi:DNA-binding response OmpR family regulator
MKVLVVDDDRELADLVGYALGQAGYVVVHAADGEEALRRYAAEQPALVVLDVNMPKKDGFAVLAEVRRQGRTPVLMLSVRAGEGDVVHGLDLGADDYLAKPFSPRTLLARVRALLRRAGEATPPQLAVGDLALDVEAGSVRIGDGASTRLTPLELRLLQMLIANAGRPVHAERLIAHVWGARGEGDRQLLKQLVHRLRQKVEDDPATPRRIVTAAGFG